MVSISTQCVLINRFIFLVVYMENRSRDQFCQHSWFSKFDFLHHDNKVLFVTCITGNYRGLSQLFRSEIEREKQ